MKYHKYLAIVFFAALIGCAPESPVLVTIDGDNYSIADFKDFYTFSPEEDSLKRMEKINEYINQMLVVREARDRGYEEDPIVKTAFETHKRDIISRGYYQTEVMDKIKISDADVRKIYNKIVEQYHIAQIVVAEESLAQHITGELKKNVPFDSLLKFSLDTMTVNGDIGTYPAVSLPDEILEKLKKTKVGSVTDAIQMGNFFYFLKVIDYKITDTPKFEDVNVSIRTNLMQEKVKEKGTTFTEDVIKRANIEYNEEGLVALKKPDSLITEADLNTWVVKKYDTAYVYVRTIRNAVQYQYRLSSIDPKHLIDRVLIPDLIYDEAIRKNFDKKPEIKSKQQNTLSLLLYQKLYSDLVLENASVDSMEIVNFYKEYWSEYKGKKLTDVYPAIRIKLRDEKIATLRNDLFEELRKKYNPQINEAAVAQLMKEEM